MGTPLIEQRHDFASKLRQPSLLPRVWDYIVWQRRTRESVAKGEIAPLPAYPETLSPISINLDLTTACNFACTHCIDWDILNGKIKYEHEKLLDSLTQLIDHGLRSVILIGGGEPTVYPKFKEVVQFLKERGIQVAVVSNGARNKVILDCARHFTKKDWVRLSLDSGTNDTFVAMHRPPKGISLEGICSYVPQIRDANPELVVGFSYIVVWKGAEREKDVGIIENMEEMVAATKLARDSRFNYISFKPFLTRFASGSEVMDESVIEDLHRTIGRIRELVNEAKTYEAADFKVVESTNLKVLEQGAWGAFSNQPKMCHKQALQQVLTPLGLFNCPGYRGVTKARIGDKNAYSNAEATAKTQKATAQILDNFDASRECANVTCLYNSMNWWIENAINGTLDPKLLEALEERGDFFF